MATTCVATPGEKSVMAGRDFSRRTLFSSVPLSAALISACSHKKAARYQGWLLVASGTEKEIAVANLASFRRVASIPLPCAADQMFQAERSVFALCRDSQAIVEIDVEDFRFKGKIGLPGKPLAVRLEPQAKTALVLTDAAPALLRIDLGSKRILSRLPLPASPADLDLNGDLAAITIPSRNSILRVSVSGMTAATSDVGAACTAVLFRRDGKTILAAAASAREVVAIDARSGLLLTRLPLPVSPSRFCFNANGGQMFVTGTGEDALAIVKPFQNEVDQTILAGRTPYAMAVSDSRDLLFVTNPASGDLTILDIETRGVSASVHVGENPGEVLLTPDGEYALVVDQRSGNVAVVRITTVLDRKVKTKPLFTVFPTAADARSALIVPFLS